MRIFESKPAPCKANGRRQALAYAQAGAYLQPGRAENLGSIPEEYLVVTQPLHHQVHSEREENGYCPPEAGHSYHIGMTDRWDQPSTLVDVYVRLHTPTE